MITKMDVMLFWEHARGFSWSEWCGLAPEERGTVVAASREYFTESVSPDETPADPDGPTRTVEVPVPDDGGLVGQVRTP